MLEATVYAHAGMLMQEDAAARSPIWLEVLNVDVETRLATLVYFVPIFHAMNVELRHIKHARSREQHFLVASCCAACRVAPRRMFDR